MKKNKKQIFSIILAVAMGASMLTGCGKNASQEETDPTKITLHIFNTKGEIAEQFDQMCKDFTEDTGIKVETMTVGSGEDAGEPLRAQINSNDPPAIFNTDYRGLPEWQESGVAMDLNTVENEDLKKIVDAIPENMRLTTDGKASYGIPYGVEGFGFIVDSQMLNDLFEKGEEVLTELRTCSYEDFTKFCDAVTTYIEKPSAAKVSLNGKDFTFQAQKTGAAKNLNGIFAVAGAENWTYGNHLLCVPLATMAATLQETTALTDDQIKKGAPAFEGFLQGLDYMTQHAAGLKGSVERGQELVNKANFGYDQSVQMLVDGNALFLQQGNWASANIAKANAEVSKRISFIPLKMPITDGMIQSGTTAEKINSSIPFSTGSYWLINAKASPAAQSAAQTFLAWMMEKEHVQKYIVDSFVAIPYNADETIKIEDSLAKSIQSYIQSGNAYYNCVEATPSVWASENVAKQLMEQYLTKKDWTPDDYKAFSDFAVNKWIELKSES